MPPDRFSLVLAAMAGVDGDAPSVIDRVCVGAVSLLSLSGAGISLMVDGQLRGSAGTSGPGIAVIQELQLELGEGPCVQAWDDNAPVLEPDLAAPARARWPAFAQAGVEAGVRAVFAYPLRLGATRLGVLVFYRDHAGGLDAEERARGLLLADVASQVVLAVQAGAGQAGLHELLAGEPPHWAEVHQATGMVSAQLAVSMDEAFVRLRARTRSPSIIRCAMSRAPWSLETWSWTRPDELALAQFASSDENEGRSVVVMTREQRIIETFVELADTMVDDFDVIEFLHHLVERCVELLDCAEAGVLLADAAGRLLVMASSSQRSEALELLQSQNDEGPCFECYHRGRPVFSHDLAKDQGRWPTFVPAAIQRGFGSVQTVPMRVRGETVGALNLFRAHGGAISERDVPLAQGMADVAAIALLQERAVRESHGVVEQLQGALTSRVVIEQAKGVFAQHAQISVDTAFARMRDYARAYNRRLSDIATELTDGRLDPAILTADPLRR